MRNPLHDLTDEELIHSLKSLAKDERGRTVALLKHLKEMDRRNLAEKTGFPSLFEYCVRELRFAHGTASRRIHAARSAAKFTILYRTIERGLLSVTTVSLLAPHLTWDNHRRLVRTACGKSKREVEALVAGLVTAPPPVERVRFVGALVAAAQMDESDLFKSPSAPSACPQLSPTETIVSPAAAAPALPPRKALRVQFSFSADERLYREVERAKELLRHSIPAGRLEDVFGAAITALLEKIDPEKRARRRMMRSATTVSPRRRQISPSLRDAVWRRDGGRCVFRSSDGRMCGARARLQLDHIVPWARGGSSNDPRNLRLLCRAHNLFEARRVFGDAAVVRSPVRDGA
jgi:5-methylcytosine-specific restriction endonuclease McrA